MFLWHAQDTFVCVMFIIPSWDTVREGGGRERDGEGEEREVRYKRIGGKQGR